MTPGHAGVMSRRLEFFCLPIDLLQHWRGSAAASGVSSTSPMNDPRHRRSRDRAGRGVGLAGRGSGRRRVDALVHAGGCAVDLVFGVLVATVTRAVAGGPV